jgi:hypothetical protein
VWKLALAQEYLEETYGVEYSIPCRRRLLKKGVGYQKPCWKAAEADEDEQEAFHDELKKRQEMDPTVVYMDRSKKFVQIEPRAARKPRGTRPSVELSDHRDWTCLLGPITGRC